jgi:hypothetical protein
VSAETWFLAFDDSGGAVAARLWFLLGYFGHGARAVLDGPVSCARDTSDWGPRTARCFTAARA